MNVSTVIDAITPVIVARGLFLVEAKVSRDNDITITVEKPQGSVTLDDCEVINRSFTEMFSQDEEDYSLTVTSAGLDGAFKVDGQFQKAIGSKVQLMIKGGAKPVGVLEAFDEESVTVEGVRYERKQINKVKYFIEF